MRKGVYTGRPGVVQFGNPRGAARNVLSRGPEMGY